MAKILVTGATGGLGRQTLDRLLERIPASQVAALAREPAKLADFAERGVDVRHGDYLDKSSLEAALQGIERLFFISAPSFTDMVGQHRNVIDAACAAGVAHIVYTGIQRRAGSDVIVDQVTVTEIATERFLDASGISYTILRNATYMDALPLLLGPNALTEIRLPAGQGACTFVARRDLAEANAVVLTTEGHEGKVYTLTGAVAVTMNDIAALLSQIAGRPVLYTDLPVSNFVAELGTAGVPEPVGVFLASWMEAIAAGEFSQASSDLEMLLGRPAVLPSEMLPDLFTKV